MTPTSVLLCVVLTSPGVTTRYHQLPDFESLARGEPLSTILTSDGVVTLGPAIQPPVELKAARILAAIPDGKGGVLLAMSEPGQVLQVDRSGARRALFVAKEPLVTALARDDRGVIYAATAPEGKIYKIDPTRKGATEYFTAPGKYVWAMVHDGRTLWAAQGLDGALYRIEREGSGSMVGTVKEKHLRALALGPAKGGRRLVAGGGEKGIVYALREDGTLGALYDSTLEEVTSLAVADDGTVYAAVVSASDKPGSDDPEKRKDVAESGGDKEPKAREVKSSEVVRIAPDGEVRLLFKSRTDGAYALALSGDRLYIGTGGRGRLYHVELDTRAALAVDAKIDSAEITALAAASDGVLWIAASTPGAVLQVSAPLAREGVYLSAALDAKRSARYGALRAEFDAPAGTSLGCALRQGNTAEVDASWGPFVEVELNRAGTLPLASRYVQIRATLRGTGSVAPRLRNLELAYRTSNQPPRIQSIEVLAPGVRVEAMPDDEPKGRTFNVSSSAFDDFRYTPGKPVLPAEPKPRARQTYETGWRTIVWNAQDDDGDDLSADVTLLGLDEKFELPLGKSLRQSFVTFASERLPDGRYRARVLVRDDPDNATGEVAKATLDGPPFVIDHTEPELKDLRAERRGKRLQIQLAVRDRTALRGAWCSQDGQGWIAMAARDGMVDEPEESFAGVLELGSGPQRPIVLRCAAEDLVGNRGLAEIRVR
ncbi:MAG: hypothetical protein ABIJ09_03865 [Pseudomonadota bacterium]